MMFLFWKLPHQSALLDTFVLFWLGFFIFGPHMLIGIAAAELSHKKAAATATGFIGIAAYMGAAVAGYPLGRLIETTSWDTFMLAMFCCSVISAILLLSLWNTDKVRQKKLNLAQA